MAGMMTGLLLLLLVGVAVGRVVDLQKRIIGGEKCKDKDRHYHVRLIPTNVTHEILCGGSLISQDWVLTAAHCVPPGWTVTAVLNEHPDPSKAVLVNAQPFPAIDNQNLIHDIMLLKLDTPAINFPTVDLPNCGNRPKERNTVQIAGRATKEMQANGARAGYPNSDDLQCADTTVVDCVRSGSWPHPEPGYYNALNNFIFFQKTDVDISIGDSGGGLVFDKKIYGVNAFTNNKYIACVSSGVATDVCEYKDWITDVTGIAIPSKCPTCKCLFNCLKG